MSCSFSNSGSWISSGGLDNICSLHRVDKGKIGPTQVELHGHTGFISSSHLLSNDSRVITSSGDGTCKLWDIETKRVIRDFDNGHVGSVEALVLSKDEKTFLSCGIDATVRLWDLNSKKNQRVYVGHTKDINDVKFHPNETSFATVAEDGRSFLYDTRTDVDVMQYHVAYQPPLSACDFSLSGRLLFVGSPNSYIYALDTLKGTCLSQGRYRQNDNITCLATSPTGHVLASSGWSTDIKMWFM
ncbi:hypothetical protein Zmor_008798 [Zophobas morio]|uniref:Uncharacterized protein n=1 Tax=Zophobas morio TaxID=2755281 RepID=A0AA38HM81_9CUCU|nr:hypothetical protein Zmor_008798 [Zophobas morio]